ncbi:hypothetical protein C8J57DRAFT_664816 [Mycena rebaudengoi]|nr:hypothetical protein C8J57DRAFT_664816 [Mycena rebaudengoi]
MSLKERIAQLQYKNGDDPALAAAVGHAAPLRAKIAQFESKGGVPVPRGSFGLGAPPVPHHSTKGELYGNRMKPVRLPMVPGLPPAQQKSVRRRVSPLVSEMTTGERITNTVHIVRP